MVVLRVFGWIEIKLDWNCVRCILGILILKKNEKAN